MRMGEKRKRNRKNKQNKKNKKDNNIYNNNELENSLINSNNLVNSNNNHSKNNKNNGGGVNVMINQCYNILNGSYFFGSFFNKFDILFNYMKSFIKIQKQQHLNVNTTNNNNNNEEVSFSTSNNNNNNNNNMPSIIIQQQQHHHHANSNDGNGNLTNSLGSLGGSYITMDDLNDQLKIVQLEQKVSNLEKEIQRMRNEQNQVHKQNLNQYHELLKQIINAASLIQQPQIVQQIVQQPAPTSFAPPPPPPPPPMVTPSLLENIKPKPTAATPSNTNSQAKKSTGVPQFSISMADITGVRLRKTSSKFSCSTSSSSSTGSPARNRVASPAKKSPFKRVLTPAKKVINNNSATTIPANPKSTPLKDITNTSNTSSPKSILKSKIPSNIIFSPSSNNNTSPYKPLTISTLR